MLAEWLESQADVSGFERQTLENLQQKLIVHVHDWNESELAFRFIGPLMALVDYEEEKFDLFTQRSFSGKIGDIESSGNISVFRNISERMIQKVIQLVRF